MASIVRDLLDRACYKILDLLFNFTQLTNTDYIYDKRAMDHRVQIGGG